MKVKLITGEIIAVLTLRLQSKTEQSKSERLSFNEEWNRFDSSKYNFMSQIKFATRVKLSISS